jgi:5-formyltetrahydrofolate cyclo-ligase
MTKEIQRTTLKARRNQLSKQERIAHSLAITTQLMMLPMWEIARVVHCYCSFGSEVATERVIARAFEDGKRVVVPITSPNSKELLYTEIFPTTRFIPDSFGIPTPEYDSANLLHPPLILTLQDCIIIPLLGFDEQCYRLGYGKGYYDRFLADVLERIPNIPTIGFAFECQHEERVIIEPHDIPLSMILTEKRVISRFHHR